MKKIFLSLISILILSSSVKADTKDVIASSLIGLGMNSHLASYLSDEITGDAVLQSNVYLKARNAAGTANIDMLKVDGSDDTVLNADSGDLVVFAIAGASETILNTTAFSPSAVSGNALGTATLPWLQAITGGVAIDADVTAVTGANVGLVSAKNTSSDADTAAFVAYGANAVGSNLRGFKTRATTTDANTIVQSGDTLLELIGLGADGVVYRAAGAITFASDGTPGSGDMPGRIIFSVTADGASSPTEAMRISNNGQITKQNATDFVFNVGLATIALQEAVAGTACSGTLTANGATPVVTSTTCATTGSRIFLTRTSAETTALNPFVSAITNGVSFAVTSEAGDTGTMNWFIIHEAP